MTERVTWTIPLLIRLADKSNKLPTIKMGVYNGGKMHVLGMGDLVVDLAGVEYSDQVVICADHDEGMNGVIGFGTIRMDNGSMMLDGTITQIEPGTAGANIVATSQRGQPWQASMGADVMESERIRAGDVVRVNGADHAGPLTWVKRARLRECSVVALGADHTTSVQIAAMDKQEKPMDEAKKDMPADPGAGAQVQASDERIGKLEAMIADTNATMKTMAAEIVRLSRSPEKPEAPAVNTGKMKLGVSQEVIECALAKGAGIKIDYPEETVRAARAIDGIGLRDLVTFACRDLGRQVITLSSDDIKCWLRASYAGVPSTLDVSGILGNVLRKALTQAFENVPTTSKTFCATLSVADFKSNTIYRPQEGMSLHLIDASGRIPAGTMGEASYTNQAKSYGRMVSVGRQQIVNDDLGVFGNIGQDFGRAAARLHDELFYSLLATAVSGGFVSTTNSNYISGASSALSSSALGAAVQKMMEQTVSVSEANSMGATTHPVLVEPKFMLVPPALWVTAQELYVSTQTTTSTSARYPNANIWQGMFQPFASPYMSHASYVNSSTAWALFADPATGMGAYEFCYLNGNQSPTIEEGEVDFDVLGVVYRCYMDVGIAQREHRGIVYNLGASS